MLTTLERANNRYLLNVDDKLITEGVDPRTFITVSGGTFYNFDISNCISEGEGTNFVADGYKVVIDILPRLNNMGFLETVFVK